MTEAPVNGGRNSDGQGKKNRAVIKGDYMLENP